MSRTLQILENLLADLNNVALVAKEDTREGVIIACEIVNFEIQREKHLIWQQYLPTKNHRP